MDILALENVIATQIGVHALALILIEKGVCTADEFEMAKKAIIDKFTADAKSFKVKS